MIRFRVWDPLNESEGHGFVTEAETAAEAGEQYVENLGKHESLESTDFELLVRCLLGEGNPTIKVKVSVDYEPTFYGREVSS